MFQLLVRMQYIFCNEIDAAKIGNLNINEKKNGGTWRVNNELYTCYITNFTHKNNKINGRIEKKAVRYVNSPQVHSGMKQQESIIYDRNYGKSEL